MIPRPCTLPNVMIDDVLKVSHRREEKAEASASEPDTEAELIPRVEDVQMSDSDSEPVKPKRKRKEKKVWPVGKNGLKKRRVVKSKMTTDERGYMGTRQPSFPRVHADTRAQSRKTTLNTSLWTKRSRYRRNRAERRERREGGKRRLQAPSARRTPAQPADGHGLRKRSCAMVRARSNYMRHDR